MQTFINIVGLIIILALLRGLFLGIFKRGQRVKGWLMVLASIIAAPLAVVVMYLSIADQDPVEPVALASSEDENTGARTGSRVEQGNQRSVEPVSQDPDLVVLGEPSSLAVYCESLVEYDAIYGEAQERFEDDQLQEQMAWERAREDEITERMTNELGVAASKVMTYAFDHGWDHRCDAIDRAWVQIELADIEAASGNDLSRVMDALELSYMQRLDRNEGGVLFDHDRFGAVQCRTEVFASLDIVGCRMVGTRDGHLARSRSAYYVAASLEGQTIVVPFDVTAEELTTLHSLPVGDVERIRVGKYVGPYPVPNLDWAEVKGYFDD
tara:strand:+ start:3879 stop:4853 length:975 start_codon:yes stop_codon:yes gene_type:complete